MAGSSLRFALAGAFLVLGSSALPSQWTPGQPVKTTSGTVTGRAAGVRKDVSEYVGIPYAKPPVGDLRWAAPVKYTGTGNINGTVYSKDCAANFQDPALAATIENANAGGLLLLTELMQLGHPVSEDCLTINVWTKPQTGEKNKAVLFWIYGGGFNTGNSNNKIYDGQFLADSEDVVVVSFNYRENVFGFPGIDGDPSVSKNAGLLDQRMALEWVRDNIASFGGDPARITMFGESAGGASADFYSYAYPDDPIIAGAIAESGTVWSFANPQPKDNSNPWNDAAKALSCPTSPVPDSVKCMRTKSMDELLKATVVKNPLIGVLGNFGPTVDDKVVFGDYDQRAAAGKFIRKPYMAGNNVFESGLFILIAGAAGIKVSTNIWATFNPAVFTCPIAKASDARAAHGLTTFRYLFFGDYPNTMLQPGSGAYHTAEIPMIFGTSEHATEAKNTAVQDRVSKFMQKTWTQFAKDPAALTKPPFNLPLFDAKNKYTKETIIGFGANNVTRQLLLPSSYDGYCEAIESIVKTIPGGIRGAIENVASGRDMGIPGLKASEVPDMSPPEPPPPPPGAV